MNWNSADKICCSTDLDLEDIIINKDEVLKFLGYGSRKAPETIVEIVEEEIKNVKDILDIKVYLTEVDVDESPKECEKAFAVLYTIGSKIDIKMNEYMQNYNMMGSLALDKIGVVCLDCINDRIKKYLKTAHNALNISHEIYPGDKDFKVEKQKDIYKYIKDNYNNTEITINEYQQLSPIKSVAMFILMGKEEINESRCSKCEKKCF